MTAIKCIWSGGGYSIWLLEQDGHRFYRVGFAGRERLGDFSTEREATDCLVTHSANQH